MDKWSVTAGVFCLVVKVKIGDPEPELGNPNFESPACR